MKKRIKEIVYHPLFSGSAFVIIGSNSVNLLNYLYHLVMGRLLGPSGYGELVALISLVGLLGILPSPLTLVVVKYVSSANSKKELNNLVGWLRVKIFQLSFLFFVLILLVSPILSSFLHITNINYLILIALSFLVSIPAALNRAILQGLLMFKQMVFSIFIESVGKLLISISLIYLGFYLLGAMMAFFISAALGCYLTFHYLKIQIKSDAERPLLVKNMILFAVPVMIQSLSTISLYTSDLILVKHFFSSYDAGLYASLSTLGKIIFFGTGPIGSVMFPIVSKRHAKGLKVKKLFLYSFFATVAISLSILIVYLFLPRFAVNLLYGPAFLESAGLLIWFGIFISLFALSSLLVNFNLSLNRVKVVLLPLIAAIAQIVAIWVYHQTLFGVILISIIVTALLLVSLLIYSTYADKLAVRHSAGL